MLERTCIVLGWWNTEISLHTWDSLRIMLKTKPLISVLGIGLLSLRYNALLEGTPLAFWAAQHCLKLSNITSTPFRCKLQLCKLDVLQHFSVLSVTFPDKLLKLKLMPQVQDSQIKFSVFHDGGSRQEVCSISWSGTHPGPFRDKLGHFIQPKDCRYWQNRVGD